MCRYRATSTSALSSIKRLPTASGKSDLALALAHRLGGEIVSCDSMQVYRRLDVGTAKPSLDEREGIAHHLIDVVDPDEDFSAESYREAAMAAMGYCENYLRMPLTSMEEANKAKLFALMRAEGLIK